MLKILILLLAAGQAAAATPSETVDAFHAALKAGEQVTAVGLLSPDLVIYESGYVERSRTEYGQHHLTEDIAFARVTTRKVTRHNERIAGDLAIVTDETETSGSFQGKPVHSFGTETVVLERQGDGWRISHAHWSSRKAK